MLLVQAQGDVESAFAALNTANGGPQTSTYELVDEPHVGPSANDVSVMIGQALRDRPDVAAERLSAQAAAKFADAGVAPSRRVRRSRRRHDADSRRRARRTSLRRRFNVTVPVFNGLLVLRAPRRGDISRTGRRRRASRSVESSGPRCHPRLSPRQDGVSASRPDESAGGAPPSHRLTVVAGRSTRLPK